MARINKVCKDCNKPFSINDQQQDWLKERGLELFERCKECRTSRRQKKLVEATSERDRRRRGRIEITNRMIVGASIGESEVRKCKDCTKYGFAHSGECWEDDNPRNPEDDCNLKIWGFKRKEG